MAGPTPITLPSGGGIVRIGSRTPRDYHIPITLPSGGGIVRISWSRSSHWSIGLSMGREGWSVS